MRLRTIRECTIFPQEIEKYQLMKNDFLFLSCSGEIEITFNRRCVNLSTDETVLIGQNYSISSVTIKNIEQSSINIKCIQMSSDINIQKTIFEFPINTGPFELAMLAKQITTTTENDLNQVLDSIEVTSSFRTHSNYTVDKIDPRLIKVNRYIRRNFCSLITLDFLADMVGVHPTYLCNTYSKVFKKSPIFHTNQLRMEKSKKIMEESDILLTEISSQLGFDSLSQFSALFKRFYSMSPSEYRKTFL
ncbi:helix-turn-helix transcriptional regulator [Paenibacillus polymyxa]|uniref:helix-turn-helix domain-containing protein n=1 Tax=Paenibacillus polymyxa TaxID=1406 RepID=UPI001BEC2861|nr:AraC family transcriptional regulator [Paenibacillus polymyxa]MBT2282937.1 helix-turn-helix transcriptional regulator [Paenibacillus polymyxa]